MADDAGQDLSVGPTGPPGASAQPPVQPPAPSGGGAAPPMGGANQVPIAALGKQAELRNKGRAMVMILQRDFLSAFEYNTPEGKAVMTALKALGPVFGGGNEEDKTKNSAMLALRQRAIQAQGMGQMGQGAMPGGGMPQPARGPIPAMVGGAA